MKLSVQDDYDITIGPLTPGHFTELLALGHAGYVLFADTNTVRDCYPRLRALLPPDVPVIVAPEGEPNKHLGTCQDLWRELFARGVGRRWCALCLGGGVLADMAGFVASTYKRGIDFLQIPTTLLSMVDSSVGGKLGVDFNEVKNSIGVFNNPVAVWIDPAFLVTLPAREVRSGYAEIVKHALIADAGQWHELQNLTDLTGVDWTAIIPASVDIKRRIVLEDPFERGLRKALNFGHTIGHALESYWLNTDRRLLHGEAIAAGMIAESWLSAEQHELTDADLQSITTYLLAVYGHQSIPESAFPALLDLMRQDKKNEDDRINFTLLQAPGRAVVNQTAPAERIAAALRYYNGLSQ